MQLLHYTFIWHFQKLNKWTQGALKPNKIHKDHHYCFISSWDMPFYILRKPGGGHLGCMLITKNALPYSDVIIKKSYVKDCKTAFISTIIFYKGSKYNFELFYLTIKRITVVAGCHPRGTVVLRSGHGQVITFTSHSRLNYWTKPMQRNPPFML